jgi:hypothetical protein
LTIVELSRTEYFDSVQQIEDLNSLKFAKQAMDWWDNYHSWTKFPPLCIRENDEDVCYLFYEVSNNKEYLTIHNILTPKAHRNKGYAFTLLEHLFLILAHEKINRFKLTCVSSSIDFYNKIGLNYWGVNHLGQYYCDFKMPHSNILEIPKIVADADVNEFSDESLLKIYEKLRLNGKEFDEKSKRTYNNCLKKMGKRYIFEKLYKRAENV